MTHLFIPKVTSLYRNLLICFLSCNFWTFRRRRCFFYFIFIFKVSESNSRKAKNWANAARESFFIMKLLFSVTSWVSRCDVISVMNLTPSRRHERHNLNQLLLSWLQHWRFFTQSELIKHVLPQAAQLCIHFIIFISQHIVRDLVKDAPQVKGSRKR